MAITTAYLEEVLKLKVNRQKTHQTSPDERVPYLRLKISNIEVMVEEKCTLKFNYPDSSLASRNQAKELIPFLTKLNLMLRGYAIFSILKAYV
ncbi:hypothetical protein [Cyclobacterium sp.]|uniref:hypothetical protein n=1 Tax=Cyclobacterium sp. TaxID=1966343 RepID=UPI0019B2FE70|nr:hypothetical protein [Cyclobacterium sp.]MBD3629614.1 hypothetical protein [Cyclobacterium sp.]